MLFEWNTGLWRQSLHIWHIGYVTEMSKNSFRFSVHDIFVLYVVWKFLFLCLGPYLSDEFQLYWKAVIRWCHPGGIINPKNMIMGHININSLRNKYDPIRSILQNGLCDIFTLSETKLDESFPTAQFHITNFVLHRKDRKLMHMAEASLLI